MWIPWGYIFPPHLLALQVCILSTSYTFLSIILFHCIVLSLCNYAIALPACHTLLSSHLSLSLSLSGFSICFLNAFFCSHLSSCFFLSLLSSVPVVLTSCPGVKGGRSRGRKGMLILSPQWRSAKERQKKRARVRKCHSSEEMRWPLHCVCVCVCRCISTERIRLTVWVTFCVFFLRFVSLP